ncbi:lmo0937 family membrane protein [Allobacillus salarius]|uniref:Lmo0937 family membrane protein n=1 Tax=Allobacillus salarius TaxID=1955272 RepID=A0A556PSZ7_9BACI|nr:lmo0937 family membrane protein [Allobacillus salarius]
MKKMLWWIVGIILAIWLIGFVLDVAGGLIHLLLIVAGIVFVFQLITGKRKL